MNYITFSLIVRTCNAETRVYLLLSVYWGDPKSSFPPLYVEGIQAAED